MNAHRPLTQARLHELLEYDQETGDFRWRKRKAIRIAAGQIAGGVSKPSGYWLICIDGCLYRAHQLAWLYVTGQWGRPLIDHRDGNPANNRWSNLRCATRSENSHNRGLQRNNTSGFKGVSLHKGKWRAQIRKDGRIRVLGAFPTPQEAHAAYVAAARELFGEFARGE
jgi:hypothetical protein